MEKCRLKKFRLFCLLVICTWFPMVSATNAAELPKRNILVWGDSLSAAYNMPREQGWVALLQTKIGTSFNVINGSISGETAHGGLSRLPQALAEHTPEILILELGANDALRGKALSELRKNLDEMIQQALEKKIKVVLLGMKIPPNYGVEYSQQFEDIYFDLAEQYGLPFLPFLLKGIADNFDLIQDDGLHPTAEAQPLMTQYVCDVLKPLVQTGR